MPESMRFTKKEQDALNKKCIEINKILISNNLMPIRESELAHLVLSKGIKNIKVNKRGEIEFEAA